MPSTPPRPWFRLADPNLPLKDCQVAIVGAPYDGSVTHARGAALAPAELRALAADSWYLTEDGHDLRGLRLRDLGDAPVVQEDAAATQRALKEAMWPIVRAGAIPVVLGGDHSITSGVVSGIVGDREMGVLWLDAHADLMDTYRGIGGKEESRFSHACPLRRICELSQVGPDRVMVVGIRDLMEEETALIRDHWVGTIYGSQLGYLSPAKVAARIYRTLGNLAGGVYISFDIDFLDPAFAPGTGTPVPGGASTRYLLDLIHALATPPAGFAPLRLAGFDVVEVAPPLDVNHMTGLAAVAVVKEMLGLLKSET